MWRDPRTPPSLQLAEALRAGLPKLVEEVCAEIGTSIPEYAIEDPGPAAMPAVLTEVFTTLAARIADPQVTLDGLIGLLRSLGRKEQHRGRSLDSAHTAIRIAFRTSWQRIAEVCALHGFSGNVVAGFAECHMAYMDELIGPVVQGYHEADGCAPAEPARLRRRLLRRLAEKGREPGGIAELADQAGWPVPAAATPVAVRPGARWLPTTGVGDVLLDLDGTEPWLLFPGPFDDDRRALLESALAGARLSVGPTVPLEQVPDSLRWARRVLALADNGMIDGSAALLSEDHLLDLWLISDPALLDEIVERRLGGLMSLPEAKRIALTETLRVWLESWSTAADVGRLLYVHPQTVRYRLHQIKERIGDQMDDPEARFGLEAALRALRLRDRGRTGSGPGGCQPVS